MRLAALLSAPVALIMIACSTPPPSTPAATGVETPAAAQATSNSPTTGAPSRPPVAHPSPSPPGTPMSGACTSPAATTRQVLERYFQLTTSGDWRMVADCWARPLDAGFTASLMRWARSGPATGLAIAVVDQVNGCDRFSVTAELADGEPVAWFGRMSVFFSVGPDRGTARIFDAGTGLAAPEYTIVTCR